MGRSGLFQVMDYDITTKTKFVAALRKFLATGVTPDNPHGDYRSTRGELELIHVITQYFEDHTEIPDKELGLNWLCDLHKHLVEAFEEFRTHPKHQALREIYRSQTEHEIPDLLDVRGGHARIHVVYDLLKFFPDVTDRMGGDWLHADLKTYFEAQDTVIEHAWRRFVRLCYRPIAHRIKAESHRGNSGLFGRTTLRSYVLAGRIMFTFARSAKQPDLTVLDEITGVLDGKTAAAENKIAAIEAILMTRTAVDSDPDVVQVSFVGDDSDMSGNRSGMNTPSADCRTCVDMIEDVIAHWDPNKFVEDRDVGLG